MARQMSLRTKLTLTGVSLVFLVGIALGSYSYYYSRTLLKEQLFSKGSYIAQSLAHNARYPIFTEDKVLLTGLIGGVLEEKDVAYVAIVNKNGVLLLAHFRADVPANVEKNVSDWILSHSLVSAATQVRDIPGIAGLYYHFAAPVFGKPAASFAPFGDIFQSLGKEENSSRIIGSVHIGISLSELDLSLRRALVTSFLIFCTTLLLGLLFIYLLSRNFLQPLQLFAETAAEIANGDFSKRVEIESGDEIGEMAKSFNHMAASIHDLMQDLQEKKRELETNNEILASWNTELEKRVDQRTFEILQANRKLESLVNELEIANRVKSEFLASTSHELRTPLNAVIGFLGLIREGNVESRAEELEYVEHAYESGKHLLILINDILDFAKIEAGKMELHLEEINLRDVIVSSVELCKGLLEKKNLSICLDVPLDLGTVYADQARTVQVMSNLLSNAIKFTERGGIVVTAAPYPERGFVEIVVQDTGIGIPLKRDEQHQVFEKFRQVDSATTRKSRGTGLGLSIAKNLVEMMGGTITIESEGTDQGTTVVFTLPLYGNHLSVTAPEEARPRGAGSTALIIDNDPKYRIFLRKILEEAGCRVTEAGNAEQALLSARRDPPEFIFLDYALPYQADATIRTASDFINFMQNSGEMNESALFIVTGYESEMVREKLAEDSVKQIPEIIRKPIDSKELVRLLGKHEKKSKVDA